MITNEEIKKMEIFIKELEKLNAIVFPEQEQLGPQFQKILYDNLWNLYERCKEADNVGRT